MIRRRAKRGARGAKRLDLSDLRAVLKDRRIWGSMGVVIAAEDGGDHFELVVEGGEAVDVLVEVELQPSLIPVSARLSGFAGGAGRGVWAIPAIGDEVLVMFPEGDVGFMPTIVGMLSSNSVPNGGGQGPAANRTIIVNGEVLVHDGSGGAEPLVKRSEYNGHTHGPGTYANGSGSVTGVSGGAADVDGTQVFKAK